MGPRCAAQMPCCRTSWQHPAACHVTRTLFARLVQPCSCIVWWAPIQHNRSRQDPNTSVKEDRLMEISLSLSSFRFLEACNLHTVSPLCFLVSKKPCQIKQYSFWNRCINMYPARENTDLYSKLIFNTHFSVYPEVPILPTLSTPDPTVQTETAGSFRAMFGDPICRAWVSPLRWFTLQ